MYATALRSEGSARSGSGGVRCARPPATVCDPIGIDARKSRWGRGAKSRWDRCERIPLGSLHVDPGGIVAD